MTAGLAMAGYALFGAVDASAQNPYLPLWEYIPDGEPYVFEDPDKPGEYRVYVYGSHDSLITEYCGREQVVWSAPVNDLNAWRYDGIIFISDKDRNGKPLHEDGKGDVLYAPDVAVVTEKDGTKTYYLYPNNQAGGRQGMVAKSKRPDGPFEVCNWSTTDPTLTDGVLRFDPGVFVDDDGKVYGYWGFETSYGAELDSNTMATVKPGTEIVENMIPGRYQDELYKFFEASSIRKIKDKYVFIYSRFTRDGEFDLPTSNYTLAYAYSDSPLGPYTYGGTIIDGRGRGTDENGNVIATAYPTGNTHGSICEIDGKWWVFYHRQTGTDEYARQAMVAPIEVEVEEGPGGKVRISEGEYTSEGFSTEGLNPLYKTPAGIACYFVDPEKAYNQYPNFIFSGSYVKPTYFNPASYEGPFNEKIPFDPIVNNTAGSTVGYKYFDFSKIDGKKPMEFVCHLVPEGVEGTVTLLVGSPYRSKGGKEIGSFRINGSNPGVMTEVRTPLKGLEGLNGKQALYLLFDSDVKGKSICELYDFRFAEQGR
ncbi:MAG: family 43 glycosylhydrolase, partial [Muribaculaceae bacterium]|nr:family 43 glycosylhydrolase [Muribaculaceae bacterium]